MSQSAKQDFSADFLRKLFTNLSSEGKLVFLKNYADTPQGNRPESKELTQFILGVAADEVEEHDVRCSAFAVAQTLVNPFSGKDTAPTAQVIDTSIMIPDSYIGKTYGEQYGLFLGYFDLADKNEKKPIFVVNLTDSMTFDRSARMTARLVNGYDNSSRIYNAYDGLRTGKTVVAPEAVVAAAYKNKDSGEFARMFRSVGCVLTSSSPPDWAGMANFVNFRNGARGCVFKGEESAPSLLVRAALTL